MSTPDPRLLAVRNLAAVLDGRSLDEVLALPVQGLDGRDQALVRELSYGLCRWYRQLHALVASRLRKPLRARDREVQLLMLLGVYQLMHTRMPPHAAVASVVEATRRAGQSWAVKLVNGVLRGIQRELADPQASLHAMLAEDLSLRFAQPKWFVRALTQAWPGEHEAILDALQQRAPMTLRLDTRRLSRETYLVRLHESGIEAAALEAVPDAVVLERPLPVERLPGFAEGLVSVQDAGAQLAARLLDPRPGQRVLDACAAPGGKTGHLLELVDDLDLTAVDVDTRRLERVRENLQRLGRHATLQAADAGAPPPAWREHPFDRILLDAPCSATGVMRRHPDIRLLRRREDIEALAVRQARLLEALWPCLRPGGKLLYCTCSLMPQENEQVVTAFLRAHPEALSLPLPDTWGHARETGRQTLPGESTMDGFYYALLEKQDG
ncbi:16S rRNA (cytosine(967)-C(5))-methyltransferase RsmB [endosymbiont of unidentified scaly snail isolate Monju]|uniref:16S rRNA (cytosine(967)-C(5))-methyltransferase RsmB n=1 Tax=endosymbiont of unidentified scaly snail isolate Monju TaxID=1248727 RepID=UPI0003891D92|nr:16S rRNA (cytosine(967)-C(5))-methyltransferase RsmB [endosymbiont of unidentified scaly snail isolate Monju]BAN68102.1 16S rRNA (cytosine967-C5)-methyltransferase [endosymbiont of unidentified scaly snail isolate Monju]